MNVIHRTTLQFIPSANEPDYPEPTWKWDPDMSAVAGVNQRYWKWDAVAERPVPMTQAERDAVDLARLTTQRDAAVSQLAQAENVMRALMLMVLDELNAHAAKVNAIMTAVDGAGTYAAMRTAIGLIADLPTRTEMQLRTAIRNKLGA